MALCLILGVLIFSLIFSLPVCFLFFVILPTVSSLGCLLLCLFVIRCADLSVAFSLLFAIIVFGFSVVSLWPHNVYLGRMKKNQEGNWVSY